MKKTIKLSLVLMALLPLTTNAQKLTLGGQVGWANPQGNAFKDAQGDQMAKLGINFDADLLYHFNEENDQMAVGFTYNSSLLFGVSTNELFDIGLYSLALYGVKGHYKFFDRKVSPYAALSLGVSQFSTPEITMGEMLTIEAQHAFGFGIKPEIGLQLGGFTMSVGYFVPMNYKILDDKISAGSLQISIGARVKLFDRN